MIGPRCNTIDYFPRLEAIASLEAKRDPRILGVLEIWLNDMTRLFVDAIYCKNIKQMVKVATIEPAVLYRGQEGRLPMDYVVDKKDEELTIAALKIGVDLDILDRDDLSLLHVLAKRGFAKAISFAVTFRGMDINQPVMSGKYKGWKPIDFAKEGSREKVIKIIKELTSPKEATSA